MRRALSVLLLSAALATVAAVAAARAFQSSSGLTVHEWGTFTSVAGPDGQAVNWQPLSGPQDLPCFVSRETTRDGLTSVQVKGRDIFGLLNALSAGTLRTPASAPPPLPPPPAPATPATFTAKVRMETPVLYFYAPDTVDVNVRVGFHQGVMSEWYPRATVPTPNLSVPLTSTVGTIAWPSVKVVPGATGVSYPREAGKSHYYAAREVDAAPVLVAGQYEKFLFYRGLADFQPSIRATVGTNGDVGVSASAVSPRLILFENRSGRIGYRISDQPGSVTIARPELNGSLDALRRELEAMLIAEGLYAREAKAMVETWRDSWFEEGTRVFYLMSPRAVDARLPLSITPAPSSVARVFVGRLELITPEMKDDVEHAIVANDLDALNRYGRFLDSIALQIVDRPSMSSNPARLAGAIKAVAASYPQTAACK